MIFPITCPKPNSLVSQTDDLKPKHVNLGNTRKRVSNTLENTLLSFYSLGSVSPLKKISGIL